MYYKQVSVNTSEHVFTLWHLNASYDTPGFTHGPHSSHTTHSEHIDRYTAKTRPETLAGDTIESNGKHSLLLVRSCVDALINTKLPLLQALPSPAAWIYHSGGPGTADGMYMCVYMQ
jgi:hypothetical protein